MVKPRSINSFYLALSLIRVPRLFLSLLLFPLMIGLVLAYFQLLLTGLFLKAVDSGGNAPQLLQQQKTREANFLRRLLTGNEAIETRICRWEVRKDPNGRELEFPPSDSCWPGSFEIALIVKEPATFDSSEYEKVFSGFAPKIHICQVCDTDIRIEISVDGNRTVVKNLLSLGVFSLAEMYDPEIESHRLGIRGGFQRLELMRGETFLDLKGLRKGVSYDSYQSILALSVNCVAIILIALFLALKAHRKVIDYFARNNALLPLVASCSAPTFYNALWIITLLRVACFLLASVPLTYLAIRNLVGSEEIRLFVGPNRFIFILWLLTLVVSIGAVTVISSIADLKQRHHTASFLFRYVPLVVSLIGAGAWFLSLLSLDAKAHLIRDLLTGLPVIGLGPLIFAPLFSPHELVLVVHLLIAALIVVTIMRRNSHWFAAHLEDL